MASVGPSPVVRRDSESNSQVQPSNEFILDGRRVALIDTPGFDGTTLSDTDVLTKVGTFMVTMWVLSFVSLSSWLSV